MVPTTEERPRAPVGEAKKNAPASLFMSGLWCSDPEFVQRLPLDEILLFSSAVDVSYTTCRARKRKHVKSLRNDFFLFERVPASRASIFLVHAVTIFALTLWFP